MAVDTLNQQSRVNWRQVGLFLGVTFGLTFLLDLVLWQVIGFGDIRMGLLLQLQMLLPAFSAMVLGLFAYRDGRISFRNLPGHARLFVYYFIAVTLIYAAMVAAVVVWPDQLATLNLIGLALTVIGALIAVVLRFVRGRGALASIGLLGAKPKYWLLFGLGFILLYGSQTALNYLFGLGNAVNVAPIAAQAMLPPDIFLVVSIFQAVIIGPFLGILIALGEEYGWRGYLQGELIKIGKVKGILMIGVIWGLWHAPIIAMGYNYPGYPVIGIFMMTLYTIVLGFILGYAVLKTGSVWLAAFLHALNNQVYAILVSLVYTPNDAVFSFGGGIFGIVFMTIIVLIILRDPVWRRPFELPNAAAKPSSPSDAYAGE